MKRSIFQIFCVLALFFTVSRCAQISPLGGGPRDTTPPKLLQSVPVRSAVNFTAGVISLSFDEFVQLRDIGNQLIVNPALEKEPEITTQGKKVIIDLRKSKLKPNTTYRINFGDAIADMNESNPLKQFDYVFSTGPQLDTLMLEGAVSESFNNKPAVNSSVVLYETPVEDSVIYKRKPDYLARTSENGRFTFNYLAGKSYRVFAFSDANKNGLYDGESEKAAFREDEFILQSDSAISLRMFREEPTKNYLKKNIRPHYGKIILLFNLRSQYRISALDAGDANKISEAQKGAEKDTVSVLYRELKDTLALITEDLRSGFRDTIRVAIPSENASRKVSFVTNVSAGKLPYRQKLRFTFSRWMDTTDFKKSGLRLTRTGDSLSTSVPLSSYWPEVNTLVIDFVPEENRPYQLRIDTGAFRDISGKGSDSTTINFSTMSRLDFGKLNLRVKFNRKQNSIVQLINENEQVSEERHVFLSLSSSNDVKLEFETLLPGNYRVKVIADDNGNRKWDSGHLIRKIQPEKVTIPEKQIKIVADWETEEEVNVTAFSD